MPAFAAVKRIFNQTREKGHVDKTCPLEFN